MIRTPQTLRRLAVATAAVTAFATFATFAQERPSDGVYKDRIDWGVMMDMSGPASASQLVWTQGFQAYMRKVNEAGGIHGRKINVLAEDDRFDAPQMRINLDKLVSQTPVLGISGLGNSNFQVAAIAQIKRGNVPIVGTYVTAKQAVDPATPLYYGGFCGFREMAQVGVGYFSDKLNLKAPKIATVHLDTASGKEYISYIEEAVTQRGGTVKSIPIKVTAADATPQVLEIINFKPDLIAIHGVVPTSILLMRALKQYGVTTPAFAITYLGTPGVYNALGADVGANNWAIGQMVAEVVAKAGPDVSRDKLVELMNKGFEVDTRGLSAPLKYTATNKVGPVLLRPISYDYASKKFKAVGSYADSQKYIK